MPMYKKSMLLVFFLAVVAMAGAMYGYYGEDKTVPLAGAERNSKQTGAMVTVYVSGGVNVPGVVSLAEGARVSDAVNACGGVLPTADTAAVNMAQVLQDGMQIRVPLVSGGGGQEAAQTSADGKVNINTADAKTLDELPGIGPAMAQRIIDYRQQKGAFQNIEDIKKVRGIGEAKYEKMTDRLSL